MKPCHCGGEIRFSWWKETCWQKQILEQMKPCHWGGEIRFSWWRETGWQKQILEQMKPCHWGGEIRFSWWRDRLTEADSWTDEALPMGWRNSFFLMKRQDSWTDEALPLGWRNLIFLVERDRLPQTQNPQHTFWVITVIRHMWPKGKIENNVIQIKYLKPNQLWPNCEAWAVEPAVWSASASSCGTRRGEREVRNVSPKEQRPHLIQASSFMNSSYMFSKVLFISVFFPPNITFLGVNNIADTFLIFQKYMSFKCLKIKVK